MKKRISKLLTAVIALAMIMATMIMPVSAEEAVSDAIEKAKEGVVQVKLVYSEGSDTSKDRDIKSGTGFLINSEHVITCNHVISTLTDDEIDQIKANKDDTYLRPSIINKSNNDIRKHLQIKVTVRRDMFVQAEPTAAVSAQLDFAVLKLKAPINERTPLAIRSTEEAAQMSKNDCYILGFPATATAIKAVQSFTKEDVVVSRGIMSNYTTVSIPGFAETAKYLHTDATSESGNSGGPIVDAEGNVVAVCSFGNFGLFTDVSNQNYGIGTDEIMQSLKEIGIDFTTAGATTDPGTGNDEGDDEAELNDAKTAAKADLDGYKKDVEFKDADKRETIVSEGKSNIDAAKDKAGVDSALADAKKKIDSIPVKKPLNLALIIAIAVAALAAILALVIGLIAHSKKKNAVKAVPAAPVAPAAGAAVPPTMPNVPPTPAQPASASAMPSVPPYAGGTDTTVLNQGAGETTVLGQGAGETTVLSNLQNYGSLIRTKNGERITINKDSFKIGREKARVDYCISDNTAIGRHHATIVSRNGEVFLVDQNSRNFTFVNDVKSAGGMEVKLNDGDKIAFGDEEFTFTAK